MAWKKVPAEHAAAFDAALPREKGVERRTMFGCPAGFANGHLFCGAHEERINVRLDAEARRKALAAGFTPFEVGGRTMKEHVCVPAERTTDVEFLRGWFLRGLEYVRALPPKPVRKAPRRGR